MTARQYLEIAGVEGALRSAVREVLARHQLASARKESKESKESTCSCGRGGAHPPSHWVRHEQTTAQLPTFTMAQLVQGDDTCAHS